MQEKILLPNPAQGHVTSGGPRFKKEIFDKIEKERISGWGRVMKNWISRNRQVPFIAMLLAVLIVGGVVILGADKEAITTNTAGVAALQENIEITLGAPTNTQPIILGSSIETITVSAVTGNGITHLARAAINNYLQINELSLSAEQMVWAEDYLQNLTGDYGLAIGQELSFSQIDITDAINGANTLTDQQIQNLSKYVN